jgi:aspartate/methionine/tyrosine aminotransferase
VNSFSKNWAMTGWRVGWISAPPEIGGKIANLIQYSTSGVSPFIQKAACAAMDFGEAFVEDQRSAVKARRLKVTEALMRSGCFDAVAPEGSFYLFFRAKGIRDTYSFARELVSSAGVGIAPGTAFGPGGEEFMRLCCLLPETQLLEAVRRMTRIASGEISGRVVDTNSA